MALIADLIMHQLRKKQAEGYADQAAGLLMGQEFDKMGPGAPETYRQGGLLDTDKPTPPQYMQAGAQLMGIPGYQSLGGNLMNSAMNAQMSGDQAAARLNQQDDQFKKQFNNLSAYQEAQLQETRFNNQQGRAATLLKQQMGFGKDVAAIARRENAGMRETVQNVATLNSTLPRLGKTQAIDWQAAKNNGAVAHDVVMTYAKSILPGEAVMSDDKGNIVLATADAPNYLKGVVAAFNNNQLGAEQLAQLHAQANARASQMSQTMEANRQWAQESGGGGYLPPQVQLQGRPAAQRQPMAAPAGPAGLPDIQWDDAPPTRRIAPEPWRRR